MKRRKLITSAALAGLAGCSFTGSSEEATETPTRSPTETPSRTETRTPTDTATPTEAESSGASFEKPTPTGDVGRIETVRPHTIPDSVPFEANVELLEQPAGDRGATITVSFRNRDTRSWTLRTPSQELPFHPTACAGRHLAVESGVSESQNGCPIGSDVAEKAVSYETLGPGEEVAAERAILTLDVARACFAAGEHQFSNGYSVLESRESDAEMSFDWGFDVIIAE